MDWSVPGNALESLNNIQHVDHSVAAEHDSLQSHKAISVCIQSSVGEIQDQDSL